MTTGKSGVPPARHPHAAWRMIDGEAFIVLPEKGQYKILNAVGSRVWELIDGVRTAGDIAATIRSEYEVDPKEAERDVQEFLDDLGKHGMLAG